MQQRLIRHHPPCAVLIDETQRHIAGDGLGVFTQRLRYRVVQRLIYQLVSVTIILVVNFRFVLCRRGLCLQQCLRPLGNCRRHAGHIQTGDRRVPGKSRVRDPAQPGKFVGKAVREGVPEQLAHGILRLSRTQIRLTVNAALGGGIVAGAQSVHHALCLRRGGFGRLQHPRLGVPRRDAHRRRRHHQQNAQNAEHGR